ncbi:MAG: hypothetical protein PHV62_05840 [Sulfuricurvum sp.]|nr:hypothetical protein [Sulfuricurvum sp.]
MTKLGAYSIEEFCKNHKISKAHFYNLQKKQLTPRIMKVGKRVLISEEAAIDWRKKMEEIC